jgi:hypothetical protein
MSRRPLVLLLACCWLVAASACGPQPDLETLKLVPALSGYYDDGQTADGQNRLLPSVTFHLKNDGDVPFTNVDLTLAFWRLGDNTNLDSKQIRGIMGTPLEPGATSESITVRSGLGYTSLETPIDFFTNAEFVDFTVKVFAKRAGRTVSLGELPVERRLLPAARRDGNRP